MRTLFVCCFLLTGAVACRTSRPSDHRQRPASANNPPAAPAHPDWTGVYCTPSEIGGFSGTVLVIERDYRKELDYTMSFYSDVVLTNSIAEDELTGHPVADGERLYVPKAHGFYHDGKPRLWD